MKSKQGGMALWSKASHGEHDLAELIAEQDDLGMIAPSGRHRDPEWDPSANACRDTGAGRSARRLSRLGPDAITAEQWEGLKEAFEQRCAYCGEEPEGGLTKDHVVPVAKMGRDVVSNIVPACQPCNTSKLHRDVMKWLAKRGDDFMRAALERIRGGQAKAAAARREAGQ